MCTLFELCPYPTNSIVKELFLLIINPCLLHYYSFAHILSFIFYAHIYQLPRILTKMVKWKIQWL